MNKENDFFKEIGKKSSVDVPRELDHAILSSVPKKKNVYRFAMIPALALLLIVMVNKKESEGWYEYAALLNDYEVLTTFEEVDPTELSDEEWDILLEDKDV